MAHFATFSFSPAADSNAEHPEELRKELHVLQQHPYIVRVAEYSASTHHRLQHRDEGK